MQYSRSFRITAPPQQIPLVDELLEAEGYAFEPEPFSPFCRRLLAGPAPLGSSLAAFFGYIYIQDRSSMLPPLALNPGGGSVILDMAASPGGKTGFLAQLAGETGAVLANEPSRDRLATLRANMARANFLTVATCSYPGEKLPLPPCSFNQILLDPPCSGWGTADKNPRTLRLWQGAKIDQLVRIQRALLSKAAELLAPGGRVLYSTCTTNPRENQEQAEWAINELGLEPLPLNAFPGFVFSSPNGYDLLVNGAESYAQGFYLCLFRQPGESPTREGAAPLRSRSTSEILSFEELAGPCFAPEALPAGDVRIFNGKARFLAHKLLNIVPNNFRWQGPLVGRAGAVSFVPDSRMRVTLPRKDNTGLVFEDLTPIRKLLTGASILVNVPNGQIPIWWRDLPLGIGIVKSSRLLAGFK